MFAVFADTLHGEEVSGRGHTPQRAWENALSDFSVQEEYIEMDSVRFYRETDMVFREPIMTWMEREDTDEE